VLKHGHKYVGPHVSRKENWTVMNWSNARKYEKKTKTLAEEWETINTVNICFVSFFYPWLKFLNFILRPGSSCVKMRKADLQNVLMRGNGTYYHSQLRGLLLRGPSVTMKNEILVGRSTFPMYFYRISNIYRQKLLLRRVRS